MGDVPGIETLLEWYARALPGAEGRSRAADEDRPRVVHGDFKCDNMVRLPSLQEVLERLMLTPPTHICRTGLSSY